MFGLTRRRLFAVVFAPALLSACLAPTLPLPPPDRPNVEGPDASGSIRMTGTTPERGAVVYALNDRTDQIVGQRTSASDTYELVMAAQVGDAITFWYTVGADQSPTIEFEVGAR
jgi:hypothetical protein